MNLRGLALLRCPRCKETLEVIPFKEERIELAENELILSQGEMIEKESIKRVIEEGVLLCGKCRVWYPIISYLAVMLIFKTPLHKKFARKYKGELVKISEYSEPKWEPQPGEYQTQNTFTEEWDTVIESDLSFIYTKEELKLLHGKVWLKWEENRPKEVKNTLNVGCGGLGVEAEALHEITASEVFAIDLSLTLFRSAQRLRKNPFIHLAIASLFYPPFTDNSFDLVYSEGVLHHTYSTYDAFKSISRFVNEDGQLFIWVYALEDHLAAKGLKGLKRKIMYICENRFLRPTISRAPVWLRAAFIVVMSLATHPLYLRKWKRESWKLKNTNHSLRDWLTPRYAHRHSFNEVIEWFEEAGFTYELHSPANYRNLFGADLQGIGILGEKK